MMKGKEETFSKELSLQGRYAASSGKLFSV